MKKKITTLMLVLAIMLSYVSSATLNVEAATTALVGSSSYCRVDIHHSLITKKGKQYAKVKLNTYDMTGWYNTSGKVRVTLYDGYSNKFICSFTTKGGTTLKLGDDHRSYKIYVDSYNTPVTGGIISRTIKSGNNFTNSGACYKWRILNPSNCTIY